MTSKILAVVAFIACLAQPAVALQTRLSDCETEKKYTKTIGIGFLSLQFGVPIVGMYFPEHRVDRLHNPFKHIYDLEPYLDDNVWHFVGAAFLTELNYRVLVDLLGADDPKLLSAALSLAYWTGVEFADALKGSGFSLHDELSDCLGIAFALIRMYHPHFPLRARIGVKEWDTFGQALTMRSLQEKYETFVGDHYSVMKTELVCMVADFYFGLALSKERGSNRSVYGVTVGYDYISAITRRTKGWWNRPLNFWNRYFSATAGFTLWM